MELVGKSITASKFNLSGCKVLTCLSISESSQSQSIINICAKYMCWHARHVGRESLWCTGWTLRDVSLQQKVAFGSEARQVIRAEDKHVVYKGRFMLLFRNLVRMKIFQLSGVAVFAVSIATWLSEVSLHLQIHSFSCATLWLLQGFRHLLKPKAYLHRRYVHLAFCLAMSRPWSNPTIVLLLFLN